MKKQIRFSDKSHAALNDTNPHPHGVMEKQIRFRGKLFDITMLLMGDCGSSISWKIYVNYFVIEVGIREKTLRPLKHEIIWNPPVEIERNEDWALYDDSARPFDENGFIVDINKGQPYPSGTRQPDYVGFYKPDYKYSRYYFPFINDVFYCLLPIPITCIVREPTAEEKLLLSFYQQLPPKDRKRELEFMMERNHRALSKIRAKAAQQNRTVKDNGDRAKIRAAVLRKTKHGYTSNQAHIEVANLCKSNENLLDLKGAPYSFISARSVRRIVMNN